MKSIFTVLGLSILLFSCVSSKKYKASLARYDELNTRLGAVQGDLANCNTEKSGITKERDDLKNENSGLNSRIADLNKQIDFLKDNNTTVLRQLQDMSVLTSSQSESIKKSLDNIGAKDAYIQDLQTAMSRKDSLNMALMMNLKGAIGNLDDQDINIKVDKGVVYIDISDKLLFTSGRYEVTKNARQVLGKVAQVLKSQPDIEFMVEGHTDNIGYHNGVLVDNWDLSVKRATAVVRMLQKEYGIDPAKIAAAGRGEYKPVTGNDTAEGRAANRRTRIVILPQLDQFFKLLEPKKG